MEFISKSSVKEEEVICSLIGEKVKKIRKNKNIGQDEFGRRMGVTRQTISAWEKNGSVLTIAQLVRIAAALKVPPIFFLKRQPIEILPSGSDEHDVYELKLSFDDEKTRDMAADLMQIMNDLSAEDISVLKHVASTMAEKKRATDEAYRKGFLNASVFCGVRDAQYRDGYSAGQEAFETELQESVEDGLDILISDAEEEIEGFEGDYGVSKCDYQEACSIKASVSDSIFEADKADGYSAAESEHRRTDGDWDDHI